ncbi:MAG TPA: XdhC family protein, partial [Gemmatimonadales bacterium]
MRGLLDEYQTLARSGPVGRAVVTQVWGSAPRPEGAALLATPDGRIAGSVSGGCVETAAAEEIRAAISAGVPRRVEWGVSHERAWEMGLSCGGRIEVLVEPSVRPELLRAASSDAGAVVATVLGGPAPLGAGVLVEEGTKPVRLGELPEALVQPLAEAALAALPRLVSGTITIESPAGPVEVFLEVFPRRPTLLIFGGVHIAMALARM